MGTTLLALALSIQVVSGPGPQVNTNPSRAAVVDSIVRLHMASSRIPGLSVALATDSETVLAKGYGVRRAGDPTAVDEHTEFLIASLTKAFTATALGLLAAEGTLSWSDPIRRHLPWFWTDDPYVTANATLRDLAAIRVGWPAGDSLVFDIPSVEELDAHVRARPVTAFRTTQGQAGNLSYTLLGQILAASTGETWFDAISDRLLAPLGMTETYGSYAAAKVTGNMAEGHAMRDGTAQVMTTYELTAVDAGAGALVSSADDLGRWIQFQLGGHPKVAGPAVVDSALQAIQRPHVVLGTYYQAVFQAPSSVVGYGHGWVVYQYRGQKVLEHAGAWAGYTSFLVLLPDADVGFALLTNLRQGAALQEIRRLRTALLDALSS